MEKKSSQLNQREQEELASQHHTRPQTAQEFASAEEMLRYDAAQTPVPPAVAERLEKSVAHEPKPARSWWQRLLGK